MTIPRRQHHTASSLADINITPFVDVVLVLLIIFMITAPILQSGIEVALPKTKTVKAIMEERLVVTIDRAQRLYLGNQPINIHQLGEQLRRRLPARTAQAIFVRCDEAVPFGAFATVMDAIAQAGIENINVVTEPLARQRRP